MNYKESLKKIYCILKHNYFIWFYLANRTARNKFTNYRPNLTPLQTKIVHDLNTTGIAFTTIEELLPGARMLEKLTLYKDSLGKDAKMQTKKTFLHYLWDAKAPLDLKNPFVNLSLSAAALSVANSYLLMFSRFAYFTLNVTLPVPVGQKAESSQRWHRDPEEQKQLKMFIYLSDVTEDRGPFAYAKKSNYGNAYGKLFPQKPPAGIYPPEGAVEKSVDSKDIVIATGKAGTVIFCDTAGLHRGGYATGGDRVMFTAFYVSSSWLEKPWYKKSPETEDEIRLLSEAQQYALNG